MILKKYVAHVYTGCGGSVYGMEQSGWLGAFAVEMAHDRCETLRANFPKMNIFEGPIQNMTLADYPACYMPVHFYTFPCKNYSNAANVHKHWEGDSLYLEALREAVMLWPEIIIIENVKGMKQFPRVMETWCRLPHYYTTEFELNGEIFTHQKKDRVFLILHRQAFEFPRLEKYIQPSSKTVLGDYLDPIQCAPTETMPYILSRMNGAYRDLPKIYDPEQSEAVNLFTNYKRDRSNFLIRDKSVASGVRPFSVREVARLHRFPEDFQFIGSLGSQYSQIIDSVMPPMAEAIGHALNEYFAAIPSLAPQPKSLGHRTIYAIKKHTPIIQAQMPLLVNAHEEVPA